MMPISTSNVLLKNALTEIGTGAIAVKSTTGVPVTGLTIGNWYAIEAFNGYYTFGNGSLGWLFGIRNDGGVIGHVSGSMGHLWSVITATHTYHTVAPAWAAWTEWVTVDYVRMYWQATTTEVNIGVYDAPHQYGDNGGTLSWRLWNVAMGIFPSSVALGTPGATEAVRVVGARM